METHDLKKKLISIQNNDFQLESKQQHDRIRDQVKDALIEINQPYYEN